MSRRQHVTHVTPDARTALLEVTSRHRIAGPSGSIETILRRFVGDVDELAMAVRDAEGRLPAILPWARTSFKLDPEIVRLIEAAAKRLPHIRRMYLVGILLAGNALRLDELVGRNGGTDGTGPAAGDAGNPG